MIGGTIDLPQIGPVPKVAVFGVVGAAVAFVGWKYYQNRNAATDTTTDTGTDTGFTDGSGSAPDTSALGPINGSYGGYTGVSGDAGTDTSGSIVTNAAWSNDALTKLTDAGSYSSSDIVAALGNYLGGQPLSSDQQTIVRAAIAVSGYPPVGSFSIISGGNTSLTVAPSGLKAQNIGTTSAQIAFTPVAGATSYRIYRSGVSTNVGASNGSPITISGLSPGTSYTVHVTGFNAAGTAGPDSGAITFKTTVGTPGSISGRTTTVTSTSIHTTFKGAANAAKYHVILNGQTWSYVPGSPFTISGLKPNTSYTVGIAATNAAGTDGPRSTSTVRTKK